MLLFEKLLLAVAIPMQICSILVKDRFLIKSEIFPILLETYLNFMGAALALTKKFWHVRTTRKGIPLNHRSSYRPDAAHPPQIQEEIQGIVGVQLSMLCLLEHGQDFLLLQPLKTAISRISLFSILYSSPLNLAK